MSACSPVVSGTTSWTQNTLAKLTLSSASAVAFQIGLYNNPDGTAWVDDLVLTREQAPISVFMQYPNFKGMIFDDQSQIATFNIVPNPSQGTIPSDTTLSDYRIDGTVTTAGGGTVLTGSWAAASSVTATLDFSSLSESTQYNIAFQLTRISDRANASSNSPYPNYTVYKHPASARTGFNISADQNQRILYNGTPTFVLGAYDSGLGYTTSQSAWEGYLASNRRLFSLPINFYLNYWFGQADNSAIVPLVQDLQSHGIGYLDTANCSGNGPLTQVPFSSIRQPVPMCRRGPRRCVIWGSIGLMNVTPLPRATCSRTKPAPIRWTPAESVSVRCLETIAFQSGGTPWMLWRQILTPCTGHSLPVVMICPRLRLGRTQQGQQCRTAVR